MAGFLSTGWLDGVGLAGGSGDERAPAVLVRRLVTGGPDGDLTLEALVPGADGADDGPAAELTLTTTYAVASELDAGDLSPAVAYMQGRLKAEGDMPALYALLAATR